MSGSAVLHFCVLCTFITSVIALRINNERPEGGGGSPIEKKNDMHARKEMMAFDYSSAIDLSDKEFRAEVGMETSYRNGCPSMWLRQKGIVPCVEVHQNENIVNVAIVNCNAKKHHHNHHRHRHECNPADLTIWVGLHGPENLAMHAKPATDGRCAWGARFELTLPGEYKLESKALYWNGNAEFNYDKCNAQSGLAWTGGQLLASFPMDKKLYGPAFACCEFCTRNPQCTHYSAVKDNSVMSGIPYNGTLNKCILFANSTVSMLHEPDPAFVSGVSRHEPFTTYLQDGRSFANDLVELSSHTQRDCQYPYREIVNVSIAGGDIQRTAFNVDVAALDAQRPTSLCTMHGAQRIPHTGRWMDITEELDRRGVRFSLPSEKREYCSAEKMDEHSAPLGFVGPVRGKADLNFHDGNPPKYYWQPYGCNYQHFSRRDIRECLQKRSITRIRFIGDSLVCSWGTGLMPTFYEILIGLNHTQEKGEFTNLEERAFDVKCGLKHGEGGKEDIDAFVTNFKIQHLLWHYNITDVQAKLAAESHQIEQQLQKNKGTPPRLYYMTPSAFCSERQEHDTGPRALKITEWLRAELPKRGWVELDLVSLSMARCFDSTCGNDGMHPMHNVRVMMAQVLNNHMCFGG